ncbi:TonB-dependent receptor [Variovorax dokdonensis]|uniref:TonB-dependent receptor n=1 Tax=Variovorax dokdonensis TaxID=344883 RepID=A0ABT7NBQ4_9BURK|nr:TonB-dependent receptor [Variovorax dokdonensis]MDM0045375.1 TonB-dependent receptor [Variovorax dokdonensis]
MNKTSLAFIGAAIAAPALAQSSVGTLPAITVTTPLGATPPLSVAGSVDSVPGDQLRNAQMQVNLSEAMGSVPGLQIQNRQNYAQDLQLSVRGFGARATFGVRGVRIYVDGVPATMPDGQGQTSNIDIGTADRVEVLRGPFSALYGNSSGGVMQVFTQDGQGAPQLGFGVSGGSFGSWRESLQLGGSTGPFSYMLGASHFETDGYRDHSAAERSILNGKLGIQLDDDSKLTVVMNGVRVRAQDPLGLTPQQYAQDPRSAALAEQYNTRKTVDQMQAGAIYERRINADNDLRLMVYAGERSTTQYQSIPPSAQLAASSAGGVIDLKRNYAGMDARWTTRGQLAGRPFELASGIAYDNMDEDRLGYNNFIGSPASPTLGVQGRLRRDESNNVHNVDPYVQGKWQFAEQWTLEAGLRYSTVSFDSTDHYIAPGNGNDSGSASYEKALPVLSLRYAPSSDLSLYGAWGRGYETPTLNELSYRPDGQSGFNFALKPSTSDNFELGAKTLLANGFLTAAVFHTRTADEIVTNSSSGGRSTFRNAPSTERDGVELSWLHETVSNWRTQLAYTYTRARYADAFCAPLPCSGSNLVADGNQIPGVAPQFFYAGFGYQPAQGWRAGVELRAAARIQANDQNTVSVPGYAVASLYGGYLLRLDRWTLNAFARVDNVFDKGYIGSVIVNESNGRYIEPAPGRAWMAGLSATYQF